MKSSARNQWSGTICGFSKGAMTSEVRVRLEGGSEITSLVTNDAIDRLSIEPGKPLLVMVKASAIALGLEFEGYATSAENQLSGHIIELMSGSVTTVVRLQLTMQDEVVASITSQSAETLGLRSGMLATALFKSNAVILATESR